MRRPSIGRLRHQLILEQPVRTPDGGGGTSESWSTVATLWAAIISTGGTENFDVDALTGRISHEIVLRYRPGIEPAMRLRLGARVFEIAAVINIDERNRWTRCLCVERDL